MAPDFETPRLVRRLDWFQDDSLVASYQQDVLADSSRQWWVADGRYQLIRPFYTLRVSPVTPEDSGTYRCRIETDPLFSSPQSTSTQELSVMVRPVAPSSPEIKSFTNRSITLVWTHNAARAHRPILRFSVSVRTVADNTRFVMAAPSNATTVIVDNLSPFTLYAFSVRAENSAGSSDFGPETTFRTLGEPPNRAPQIQKIRNITSECVEVTVTPPDEMNGELDKYLVLIQTANETAPRKLTFDKPTSTPLTICALNPSTEYALAIEADNGFGTSPPATLIFFTEDSVPNWSPSTITSLPVVGKPEITVLWPAPPLNATEKVTKYHLYYKANNEDQWKIEHLSVNPNGVKSKMFKYRLVDLNPNTLYRIRVSASTIKGEGSQSADSLVQTDVGEPGTVSFKELNFDCKNGVKLSWNYEPSVNSKKSPTFTVKVTNQTTSLQFNTTKQSLDIIDLSLYDEYSLRIMVLERSTIDNSTILIGKYSESHRFILKDKCSYQSSFCSPGEKCAKLTSSASNPRYISVLIVIFAIIIFAFICFIIVHFARGSMNFKHLLKKKEKCVYLEEISPLVYDSVGQEDIPVELFYGYVEDLNRNDAMKFKSQFQILESQTSGIDSMDSCESTSSADENSQKNRYNNIGAMEATRIRLNSPTGNDYINANYVDSCNERNAYIATQAPLPSTFSDFWSMIWQERSNVIVCITNMIEDGKRKCDQYWPSNQDCPQIFGNYQVTLISESTNSHFSHRVLDLKIAKSVPAAERKVHQLHFSGWPDHGVPSSVFPLLNFIHYTSDIHSTGPVVVHCSAGVGRSGSYILVDSMRRHLISFRRLNVQGHLTHMRRQRAKLVQTLEQYIFCHEAIRQLIRHGITRVHSDLFMRYLHYLSETNLNGKTRMQLQFEDVCECKHHPRCQIDSDVITLPGYHRSDEFMVGSWSHECDDLWKLIWKRKVQTIVVLNQTESFWKKQSICHCDEEIHLQHGDNFVLLQKEDQQLCVRIVNVSRSDLDVDFWREIENVQKQRITYHDAPLLILAQRYPLNSSSPTDSTSTLSLSMLFNDDTSLAFIICAATTLACQLETTGCVDVVQVLSSYTHIQCGIFSSKQEIEIIYEKISQLVGGTRV
uniref:protein-tyrosine-phosphatase n=1 Tax=Caenorhabditis tropicalis TaxID=1561998 RepID=A0A1I7TD91_9PELO